MEGDHHRTTLTKYYLGYELFWFFGNTAILLWFLSDQWLSYGGPFSLIDGG